MPDFDPNNPVHIYLRELENVAPLAPGEVATLLQRRHLEAFIPRELNMRRLIETHLHLVVAAARKHAPSGIELLDLIQEGNITLMRAITLPKTSPTSPGSSSPASTPIWLNSSLLNRQSQQITAEPVASSRSK